MKEDKNTSLVMKLVTKLKHNAVYICGIIAIILCFVAQCLITDNAIESPLYLIITLIAAFVFVVGMVLAHKEDLSCQ